MMHIVYQDVNRASLTGLTDVDRWQGIVVQSPHP